jgi:hypothetical protein
MSQATWAPASKVTASAAAYALPAAAKGGWLQRKCPSGACAQTERDERQLTLQRWAVGGQRPRDPAGRPETAPASVDAALRSPGQPLDPATRALMESRFGHSFGQVRVHSDAAAAASARDVGAFAYTWGHDVVFGAGSYAPGTRQGRALLAHELAHVVQQQASAGAFVAGAAGPAEAASTEAAFERQADHAAGPFEAPPDTDLEDDEFAAEAAPGIMPGTAGARATGGCALATTLDGSADDRPHQDSATIECDGAGGYRVYLGWAATATCGIRDCVRGHEESHIRDWQGRWPNGCKNDDGTSRAAGARVPTGGDGYADFLRQSECRAYTGEVPCGERLLASATDECKPTVESQLATWRSRKTSYCT